VFLGETYAQAGDTAKARATFKAELIRVPGPINLGLLSLKVKKPEEAIKYLNQAWQLTQLSAGPEGTGSRLPGTKQTRPT
jgi:predicted Zn-dependent protease